jgi:phenylalanyl-tRNA synthetase alpha chain
MTSVAWTQTQIRRFKELGLNPDLVPADCSDSGQRDRKFQQIEKERVKALRGKLSRLLDKQRKTRMQQLRERLEDELCSHGFTQVTTPTITTRQALKKMTVQRGHPLEKQIFWLNEKQCLRPMLAPNLYSLMRSFGRLKQRPIRFFEIGSCFRRESQGARHSNEFTMLNLVEMGLCEKDRGGRLELLADLIMKAAGVDAFSFQQESSQVYGATIDVVAGPDGIEVASGAMGPHPLDAAWAVTDTWVGMGFGLERILMVSENDASIGRWVKSLSYVDGISLFI